MTQVRERRDTDEEDNVERFKKLLVCGAIAAAAIFDASAEDAIDLSLNGNAVRLAYDTTIREDSAEWGLGWLHHTDNGDVLAAGFHFSGPVGSSSALRDARLILGGKIAYFADSGNNGLALAVGGRFSFPFLVSQRLYAAAEFHYAPGLLTFADGDAYREFGAEFGFRVIPLFDLYVGARSVRGEFDDGTDTSLDRGFHFGLRGRF